jgi:hypothetical protein
MNAKQKKYSLLIGGVLVLTGVYLYWRRRVKKEGESLLAYVNSMPSQVNLTEAAEQGIKDIKAVPFDANKLKVDNLSGSIKDTKIKNALANVATELYAAMKGPGTNVSSFAKNLNRIKNKNTLKFLNELYKALFKEDLFQAMKSETSLNNTTYALWSDKTKYNMMIPGISDSHWNPVLAQFFNNLKIY